MATCPISSVDSRLSLVWLRASLQRLARPVACAGGLSFLVLAGPAFAQAPFPGAVAVCVNGEHGWVPASHPLAQSSPCDSVAGPVPTPAPGAPEAEAPGGAASRPLELGHLYMDGFGEVVRVIGLVKPTLVPGTVWLLESLGPRACGRLSYWPVDRPRGDGFWQEITEWYFTANCPAASEP